jgi:hypothetical protein
MDKTGLTVNKCSYNWFLYIFWLSEHFLSMVPRYSWNTAKGGVKHQSINQSLWREIKIKGHSIQVVCILQLHVMKKINKK